MSALSRWLVRLPAIAVSVAIFLTSSTPIFVPQPFVFADKIYHFVVYAVYGLTLILAVRTFHLPPRKAILIAVLFGLVFAATDELHQYYVPGRSADVIDWLADAVGVGAAAVITYLVERHANAQTDI